MANPTISLIAAIADNRALGKNNDLIYKIPEDLKRFREITKNHPIIMGRKTFESIGRPLPNRTNIVISRDPNFSVDGVTVVNSLDKALHYAQAVRGSEEPSGSRRGDHEVFVIGGGQIFEQAINLTDKLYLTVVEDTPEADVFFPDYSQFKKIISEESRESEGYKYKFLVLEKP